MTRRWLQLGVAFALIVAVGGHWSLLQSVAWVGMAVTFSRTAPLSVALEKTFDGRHPCQLCLVVAQGKKSEQPQRMPAPEMKLDFFSPQQRTVFYPPTFSLVPVAVPFASIRVEPPPGPPPRRA